MKCNRFVAFFASFLVILVATACLWLPSLRSALVFSPDSLQDGRIGVAYEAKILVTHNATPVMNFTISDGALPKGLTLEKMEGADVAEISGIPEEAGSFTFKVGVSCYGTNVSGQTGEETYTLIVGQ